MPGWEDPPIANETSWEMPNTFNDAAIAADAQTQEFSSSFAAMNIETGVAGEKPEMSPTKFREYGIFPSLPLPSHSIPLKTLNSYVGLWIMQGYLTLWCIEPDPEPTLTSDEAWTALVLADQERDLDDFKVFFLEYVRNNKELTFVDLEKKFREEGLGVYLIAIVSSLFLMESS
jgi:hypothetical protein